MNNLFDEFNNSTERSKRNCIKKNNFFEGFIQFYYFQIHTKTLLSLPFIYE